MITSGALALLCLFAARRSQADDAPQIANVNVTDLTTSSAVVHWSTDRGADSILNYSEDPHYGVVRDQDRSKSDHELMIMDLTPGTTYFFKAISTDDHGNQGISGDFTLTTNDDSSLAGLNNISSQDQKTLAEKAASLIGKITDQKALKVVDSKVNSVAAGVVQPPKILGYPKVTSGAQDVTIDWTTDREANSMVYLASQNEYDAGRGDDTYSRKEGNDSESVTTHEVHLTGLAPDMVYHYKVVSGDTLGEPQTSDDNTFTTKSLMAQVVNVRVQKVEEHTATISWQTSFPASGVVQYTNLRNHQTKTMEDDTQTVAHSIKLNDLDFKTTYSVLVKTKGKDGTETDGMPLTFVTIKDETPPIISHVSNDSTLYPGDDTKIQTIVSWETDESATCQFFSHQSVSGNDADAKGYGEETNPAVDHVQVITDYAPSTVYQFWVECKDANDNKAKSEYFVLYTPEKEKSILDMIMQNFQGTFGWMKNIGK